MKNYHNTRKLHGIKASAKVWKVQIEIPREIYLNGKKDAHVETTNWAICQVLN